MSPDIAVCLVILVAAVVLFAWDKVPAEVTALGVLLATVAFGLLKPEQAVAGFASDTVIMYKPARWMEYGLQFYRYNNAKAVFNPEDLIKLINSESRFLCITEDKTLDELARLGSLDMEIVHTIGNQTAFWVWPAGD